MSCGICRGSFYDHLDDIPFLFLVGHGGRDHFGKGVGLAAGDGHLLGPGAAEGIAVVPEDLLEGLGVGHGLGALGVEEGFGVVAAGQDPEAVVHPGAEDHLAVEIPVALALEAGLGHTGAFFRLLLPDELCEAHQALLLDVRLLELFIDQTHEIPPFHDNL